MPTKLNHVTIIHRRRATDHFNDNATVALSPAAAEIAEKLKSQGIMPVIQQGNFVPQDDPVPVDEGPTVGVTTLPAQKNPNAGKLNIHVFLLHLSTDGVVKQMNCYNEMGENSPQATLEKLLLSVVDADLAKVATHA